MSTMQTLRLWLAPHSKCPQFRQLRWEVAETGLRDIIAHGVHPWIQNKMQYDQCPSLADALLMQVNSSQAKLPELEEFGLCPDIPECRSYYPNYTPRAQRILDYIEKNVYFAGNLTFPRLVEMARQWLREHWDRVTARQLAERSHPGFQELRKFLKSKDKGIKLAGYNDMEYLDIARLLTVDDFAGRETLLVEEAFPVRNFRTEAFIGNITDGRGRLRLVEKIQSLTSTSVPKSPDYSHVQWHVEVDGESCRFRPELGGSLEKRAYAKQFSQEWRTDKGALCFNTTLDRLTQMVEHGVVVPSFPYLHYPEPEPGSGPVGVVDVTTSKLDAFCIQAMFPGGYTAEQVKEVLREYGVSMTGAKDALVRKLTKLAAREYASVGEQLDAYFTENRFIRIAADPKGSANLPLLHDRPTLRNLLLAMYALQHLRGEAVLDPSHVNDACTPEQVAHAMLTRKVHFTGALLRVA